MKNFTLFFCLFFSFVSTLNLLGQDHKEELDSSDDSFVVVEQMPEFPGGIEAMLEFIYSNVKYPTLAKENNIDGLVVVSFIVEIDGDITNVEVKRDIGGGCGEEAARVIGMMPKWSPGEQDGELVRVSYNLPVRYKLEGNESEVIEKPTVYPVQNGVITQENTFFTEKDLQQVEKLLSKIKKSTGIKVSLLSIENTQSIDQTKTYADNILLQWESKDSSTDVLIVFNQEKKESVIVVDESEEKNKGLAMKLFEYNKGTLEPALNAKDISGLEKALDKLQKLLK